MRHKLKHVSHANRHYLAPYIFMAPTLLIFVTFLFYPAVYGFYISLTNSNGLSRNVAFVGFENYLKLFQSTEFWNILWLTTKYTLLTVPLLFASSLAAAMLVNNIRGKSLIRAIIYWPALVSPIVVGLTWKWLFGDTLGLINRVLTLCSLPAVKWLSQGDTAMFCITVATLWSGTGVVMVMFLAGLKNIPVQYYEAAAIDGASRTQMFRRITFPLLKPTNVLVMITLIIGSFKAYPLIKALTKGGPGKKTTLIVQHIYDTAFSRNLLGFASAMSVVLFVILALLTLVQFKITNGGEDK